ncbi:MAG: peptidylprolyl isomerase [Paracoccaceae bacterium]
MNFRAKRHMTGLGLIALLAGAALSPTVATAQNVMQLVARVDEAAITQYELDQRLRLLQVLSTPGDLEQEAMDRLIAERLQLAAARRAGVLPSDAEIDAGIEEFASRADATGEEFMVTIGENGVARESFRDFMIVGLAWRNLVRARFGARAQPSEADIDRAINMAGTQGSARVLISEIFLPTNTAQNAARARAIAAQIMQITTIEEFASAARQVSAGPSRVRGGEVVDWVDIGNLPASTAEMLLALKPGEVSDIIDIPNALVLLQLREFQATEAPHPANPILDYATYAIAAATPEAALARAGRVRAQADVCDDLYGIARNEPAEVLQRIDQPLAQVPRDIALELAKLDSGETSTALRRDGGATVLFVMLCSRRANTDDEVSREQVGRTLSNQRIEALAAIYLDELQADAKISFP